MVGGEGRVGLAGGDGRVGLAGGEGRVTLAGQGEEDILEAAGALIHRW